VISQLVVFKTLELYPFVQDGVDAGASDAEVGWPLGPWAMLGRPLGKSCQNASKSPYSSSLETELA